MQNKKSNSKKLIPVLLLTALFLTTGNKSEIMAQEGNWSLSGGVAAGYAPTLNHGSREIPGTFVSLFGDLEYKNLIGRLRGDMLLSGSLENSFTDALYVLSGSLGYNFSVGDKIKIPVMVSGGAAITSYTTSVLGSSGDTYHDASPQIGLAVSPYYRLTRVISLQAGFRFLKGFEVGDRGKSIDMNSVSLGIRISLF